MEDLTVSKKNKTTQILIDIPLYNLFPWYPQ